MLQGEQQLLSSLLAVLCRLQELPGTEWAVGRRKLSALGEILTWAELYEKPRIPPTLMPTAAKSNVMDKMIQNVLGGFVNRAASLLP